MTQLNDTIQANLAVVVAVLAAVYLVLLIVVLVQFVRVRRLRWRLDALTRGADGRSLETVFSAHLETVLDVARQLDGVRARTAAIERALPVPLQRFALVRFNPFEDTGGNQSFALALLDGADNGVVVSSLHSRTGTRVYAKEIKGAKSDTALSAEEAQALERAQARTSPAAARPQPAVARPPQAAVRPAVSAQQPRFVPGAPASTGSAAGSGSNGEPAIDAGFLERRLRGEDDEPRLWGDPSR